MLLIEADGKALFRDAGIRVPESVLLQSATVPSEWLTKGRVVVKSQVPVGGRGKSGGIAVCRKADEIGSALARTLGCTIRGHIVRASLIEQMVSGSETYLSFMVNPDQGKIRLTFAAHGGVDIEESTGQEGAVLVEDAAVDSVDLKSAMNRMTDRVPDGMRQPFRDVADRLANLFLERELLLAEINPLFIDGETAIAGDAKVIVDVNALVRQGDLCSLIRSRPAIYADTIRKLDDGFDYVELDPGGSIGLITTGAGLSMMLVDELVGRGGRPINFCDVRTGQLRGSPDRLVRVLEWLADKTGLRVIFVNVFAGITDLSEFAALLVQALAAMPDLGIPVVARLVGNGQEDARQFLARERPDIVMFSDMEAALKHVSALAAQ